MLLTWENCAKNPVFYEINNVENTIGFNNYSKRYNSAVTTHAEMDCLKRLAFKMCKVRHRRIITDLVVIRVNNDGTLGNSQPCKHCAIELIKNKKITIRHLYFSNSDGKIEKHNFKEWYQNTEHHVSSGWRHRYKKH